jgi:Flp pilus assembly protein TadD
VAAAPVSEAPSDGGAPLGRIVLSVVVLAGLVAVGVYGLRSNRAEPAPTPDPQAFAMATLPPADRPALAPPPAGPGAEAYAEASRKLAAGDKAGAADAFARAAAAEPSNADFRVARARVLWDMGARDEALRDYQQAAQLSPKFGLEQARALDGAGQAPEAMRAYEALLQADASPGVKEEYGRLLYRTGDHAKALPYLEVAVATRPNDPVLRQEMAYSLEQAGRKEEAAAAYRAILQQAPQADVARGLLAENLQAQGKTEEALAVLGEGLSTRPQAPLLQRAMGSLFERTNKPAEAAQRYREYARLAPNAPDAKELEARAAALDRAAGRPQS